MPKRTGPVGGWPTRWPTVYVRFPGGWLVGSLWIHMEVAEGAVYHTWRDWTGGLDLGVRRPRGCPGLLVEVRDVLEAAEAGLLVALGAEVAHVCHRIHHQDDDGHGWCWCDACSAHRYQERKQ